MDENSYVYKPRGGPHFQGDLDMFWKNALGSADFGIRSFLRYSIFETNISDQSATSVGIAFLIRGPSWL